MFSLLTVHIIPPPTLFMLGEVGAYLLSESELGLSAFYTQVAMAASLHCELIKK